MYNKTNPSRTTTNVVTGINVNPYVLNKATQAELAFITSVCLDVINNRRTEENGRMEIHAVLCPYEYIDANGNKQKSIIK